jgi:Na+/melibiose symporter-like transporter
VGKRLEAVIFSCQSFVDKVAAALGALVAGLLLTLIHYPTAAENVFISESVRAGLGLSYMGVWGAFASVGIWFVSRYEITRSSHAAEIEVS